MPIVPRADVARSNAPGMDEEIQKLIWITEWMMDVGYSGRQLRIYGVLKVPVGEEDDEYSCRIKAMETFNKLTSLLRARGIQFAEFPDLSFTGEIGETLDGSQRFLHQRANVSFVFRSADAQGC